MNFQLPPVMVDAIFIALQGQHATITNTLQELQAQVRQQQDQAVTGPDAVPTLPPTADVQPLTTD